MAEQTYAPKKFEEIVEGLPNTFVQGQGFLNPFQQLEKGILTPDTFNKMYPNILYQIQELMIQEGTLKDETPDPSFMERLGAGIKLNDLGKETFLENFYGKENVFKDENDQMHIRKGPGYAFRPFDLKQWQKDLKSLSLGEEVSEAVKDVADVGGFMIEAIPAMFVGAFTADPYAAAGAAAAGNSLRQVISATLPGDEGMDAIDRMAEIGLASTFGFGGQKITNWVVDLGSKILSPRDFLYSFASRNYIKSMMSDKELAKLPVKEREFLLNLRNEILESERLQKEVGEMTMGEITSDDLLLKIEGLLKSYYLSKDIATPLNDKQLTSVKNKLVKLMEQTIMADKKVQPILGEQLQKAYQDVLDELINIRQGKANDAFGEFTKKTIVNPDGSTTIMDNSTVPVIRTGNLLKQIKNLIDEYKGGAMMDDAYLDGLYGLQDKIAKIGKFDEGTGEYLLTAKQANQFIQDFSNASKGSGKLLKDVDTMQTKRPSRLMLNAMMEDLDNTASKAFIKSQPFDASMVEAIKKARNVYKDESFLINYFQDSFLKQFVDPVAGTSGEKMATRFAKLDPSQFKIAIGFLKKENPSLLQNVKQDIIETAIEQSSYIPKIKTAPGQASDELIEEGGLNILKRIDPEKFKNELDKLLPGDKAKALFNEKELAEINDLLTYIGKVNFADVERSGVSLDVAVGFQNVKGLLARLLGFRWVAKTMLSEEGRLGMKTFIDVAIKNKKLNTATKGELQALNNFLLNLYGAQEGAYEIYQREREKILPKGGEYEQKGKERGPAIPRLQAPETEFPYDLQSFNMPSPKVNRGQGADVVPPIAGPINPQTVASLESVGLPLFNAAEGGIVDLYESKKFKKPQVVA